MMLAITGQWVAEVTVVLCLFGAACIGLATIAGEGSDRAPPRRVEQKTTQQNPSKTRRERQHFD
jgi:hypothetical protein